jgi:hypothetical protein
MRNKSALGFANHQSTTAASRSGLACLDGNVGVGVFPEGKEVFVGALLFCFGGIALHGVGATSADAG